MSEPERPATNLAGTVLEGAYRLVRLKGEGGMGAVYEAIQLRLNKRVAVKLMARELASNQEALLRFHREAEITSQLGHPHLVNVIDFGTAESGEPYLVMEYLEGEDLEHVLQRVGSLNIEATANITKQVASALGAAHAKEVVHRDLKPANVFLMQVPGEPEFVKVLDFGISKVKAARAKLTRATAVIGTPNYMSPEQAAGRVDETDHRADQWALACIVWEMLSGRTPFVADDVSPLFYQITNLNPEPLGKRVAGLPPEVEPVLLRALAKKPAERFPTIRDFSRAFEEAALGRPADLTPTPVNLSDPWVSKTGVGKRPRASEVAPLGSRDWPVVGSNTDREQAKQVTTFSHTTGELTQQTHIRRFRPVYALAVAAGLALIAGGFIFFRTTGPLPKAVPGMPAPPPAAAIPTPPPAIEPLPTPPPTPLPTTTTPTPGRHDKGKVKTGTDERTGTPAGARPKGKGLNSQPRRRIFQEL